MAHHSKSQASHHPLRSGSVERLRPDPAEGDRGVVAPGRTDGGHWDFNHDDTFR